MVRLERVGEVRMGEGATGWRAGRAVEPRSKERPNSSAAAAGETLNAANATWRRSQVERLVRPAPSASFSGVRQDRSQP